MSEFDTDPYGSKFKSRKVNERVAWNKNIGHDPYNPIDKRCEGIVKGSFNMNGFTAYIVMLDEANEHGNEAVVVYSHSILDKK